MTSFQFRFISPFTYTPNRPKSCTQTCNRATDEQHKVFPLWSQRKKQDRFAHHLKVANRSFSVAQTSPARAGAQRSEREKGGDFAPGDSKGRSPWRAFGDFPRDGKVTRGAGRSACIKGGVQRRVQPSSQEGCAEGRRPSQKKALSDAKSDAE